MGILLYNIIKLCALGKFVDELTDPAAQPVIWISKWVDYSDKYGFGYQLSDDGVGVMYNDGTRLIMLANGYNIHYINREGDELYYTVKEYPANLEKKMKLMNFFLKYMNEHLMKAGGSIAVKQSDSLYIFLLLSDCGSSTNCGTSTDTHRNEILSAVSENGTRYLVPTCKMELGALVYGRFRRSHEKGRDGRSQVPLCYHYRYSFALCLGL